MEFKLSRPELVHMLGVGEGLDEMVGAGTMSTSRAGSGALLDER